jgi:hypothetical protein
MKKAILTILLTSCIAFSQSKADYYIISNPADYNIANQYQQTMSGAEKRDKLADAPLRVVNPDRISGDQISHVAKCVYNGEDYFLLKNDDGKFVGETKSGRRSFQNCTVIEDTVVIAAGGLVKIVSLSGQVRMPGKGVEVIRFFKSGPRYYVGLAGEKAAFGWSDMEPVSAWRKAEKAVADKSPDADSAIPELYRQRIREKIAAANESYKACFDHFNAQSNDQKSPPSWSCENSGAEMRCELSGPWKNGDRLSESTEALVQELENVLLGSDFGVKYNDGVMEIKRRKNTD